MKEKQKTSYKMSSLASPNIIWDIGIQLYIDAINLIEIDFLDPTYPSDYYIVKIQS
jgi:hypothetical protein